MFDFAYRSFSLNTNGYTLERSKLNTNVRIGTTYLKEVIAVTDILELMEELIPKQFYGSNNILVERCVINVPLALRLPQ
jgi:hypothetical protein